MKEFVLMIQFLTRIPINTVIHIKEEDFHKGVVYFPLVGLLIGSLNALIYFIASRIIQGVFPLMAVIIFNTLITGALHLDGLADTCDGLFSARKKERMLEIMRDSRIGTNGALALIFSILLKIALLDITPKTIMIPTIIMIPVMGRGVMAIILYGSTYARKEGLGNLFIGKTSLTKTLISAFITMAIAYICLNLLGVLALMIAIVTAFGLRRAFNMRLGGLTGDLLGAINEVVELVALFSIVVIWGYM